MSVGDNDAMDEHPAHEIADLVAIELEALCAGLDCAGYLEAFDELRRLIFEAGERGPTNRRRIAALDQILRAAPSDFRVIARRFLNQPSVQQTLREATEQASA